MKNMLKVAGVAAVALAAIAITGAGAGRDRLSIVGSSTVFPFSSATAEQFASGGQFATPKVESTGTGGGMSLFCKGVGVSYPDITNASRPMKASEYATCQRAGVKDITEIKVGYDGIVIANSKNGPDFIVTKQQLFMALAKQLPSKGKMIANPFKTWNQISPGLPATEIEVMGPPPTSGTRDAFMELVMEPGALTIRQLSNLKSNNENAFKKVAYTIREDGAWKDAGENDNLIVSALTRNPKMVGVFGFSFYEENQDKVQAATVNGKQPSFAAISDGSYPVSRSLYFYIKKQNIGVVPGIQEYAREFLSEKAAGSRGYLRGRGLVPLPASERAKYASMVETLPNMKAPR